jgi:hypothetical protein
MFSPCILRAISFMCGIDNGSIKNELSYCGIVTQLRGMAKV